MYADAQTKARRPWYKESREAGLSRFVRREEFEMTENKRPWSPPQIIWSALIGIVVWTAVGFSWFGQGFGWVTQGAAKQASAKAVVENLATICVAQARGASDAETALTTFADLANWKRREYVETAGWANMPGSESSQNGVAELCATKLREL